MIQTIIEENPDILLHQMKERILSGRCPLCDCHLNIDLSHVGFAQRPCGCPCDSFLDVWCSKCSSQMDILLESGLFPDMTPS